MAVAVDNTGQSAGAVSASTITISSFVVGAGSDRVIYLAVSQWKASDVQPTAVFNGSESFVVHDSVTIGEGAGTRRVTLLKLVNPTVTTANIVISWASAVDEAVCGATSWNGVDQATPFGTAVKNSGTGTSSSVIVANAPGDVVHDAISADSSSVASVTANQSQRWRAIAAAGTTEGAGQSAAGAGSNITCTWTNINPDGGGGVFAHIGVAIQQASGGGGGTQRPVLRASPLALRRQGGGLLFAKGGILLHSRVMPQLPPAAAVSTFQAAWAFRSNSYLQRNKAE